MLIRSVGGLLRGRGTPLQFMLACVLGAMVGFVPGLGQAPGLLVALTLLLILLNTNLFLALLAGLVAKALALVSLPVSFAVGRWLLDGPTQGFFKSLVNAPVWAFFGFEYYAVTGGLVVGLIVGVTMGLAVIVLVNGFRRKMAGLEEGSERYQRWTGKRWVRAATWVLAGGGKGKATYAQLLARKFGNPVRPLGVVFAALVVALLFLGKSLLSGPLLATFLKDGLERVNGATVDVERIDIDLAGGNLEAVNIAMADPENLETDLFRAARLKAKVNTRDLLRKRVVMDAVVVDDAATGVKRARPGYRVGAPRTPPPADPPKEGEKTLEDYLEQAKLWRDRIRQAKEWLDRLSGPARPTEQREETLEERLERQIRESGYARVKANHLIEGSPTFTVTSIEALKVRAVQLGDETLDIRAENLSTHPNLLDGAPRVSIRSALGTLVVDLNLGGAARVPALNTIVLGYHNLPTDSIAGSLKLGGHRPLAGGKIDLDTTGRWATGPGGMIDLPLKLTLTGTTFAMPGMGKAEQLSQPAVFTVGLRGTAESPKLIVDPGQVAKALADAGVQHFRSMAEAEVNKAVEKGRSAVETEINKGLSNLTGGLLGGGRNDDKDRKKQEEAERERQKAATRPAAQNR